MGDVSNGNMMWYICCESFVVDNMIYIGTATSIAFIYICVVRILEKYTSLKVNETPNLFTLDVFLCFSSLGRQN